MECCPVCLENNATCQLVCKHAFCTQCLKDWHTKGNCTCPMCRRDIYFKGFWKVRDRWNEEHEQEKFDEAYGKCIDDLFEDDEDFYSDEDEDENPGWWDHLLEDSECDTDEEDDPVVLRQIPAPLTLFQKLQKIDERFRILKDYVEDPEELIDYATDPRMRICISRDVHEYYEPTQDFSPERTGGHKVSGLSRKRERRLQTPGVDAVLTLLLQGLLAEIY